MKNTLIISCKLPKYCMGTKCTEMTKCVLMYPAPQRKYCLWKEW